MGLGKKLRKAGKRFDKSVLRKARNVVLGPLLQKLDGDSRREHEAEMHRLQMEKEEKRRQQEQAHREMMAKMEAQNKEIERQQDRTSTQLIQN